MPGLAALDAQIRIDRHEPAAPPGKAFDERLSSAQILVAQAAQLLAEVIRVTLFNDAHPLAQRQAVGLHDVVVLGVRVLGAAGRLLAPRRGRRPRPRGLRGGPERSGRGARGQVQKKRRGQPRRADAREAARRADCKTVRRRTRRADCKSARRRSRALRVAEKNDHAREAARRRAARRRGDARAGRGGGVVRRDGRDAAGRAHLLPGPHPARYIDEHKRRRRRLLQAMAPRRAALLPFNAGQLRLRRAEWGNSARARHEPREERRELEADARRLAAAGGLGGPPKYITRRPVGELEHGLYGRRAHQT
mgnify:CR=1 FL=1